MGFSITSAVEILYWMFIKPFGLPMKDKCTRCYVHHYPSNNSKRITRIGQGFTTTVLIVYFWYRMYLVAVTYYHPPIPEENRNKLKYSLD